MTPHILIVEDDVTFSLMLKTWLGKKNIQVDTYTTVGDAKKALEEKTYQLILSDLRLPDEDGINLLKWLKENHSDVPLIMMTSYADIQTAVQAIKLGAADYISKPLNPDELFSKITELIHVPEEKAVTVSYTNPYIEGVSQAAVSMYEHVHLVAPTEMSVLITGSSGTGKEYIARRIHQESRRAGFPFVAVDCGAIPKDLAASEFFGHVVVGQICDMADHARHAQTVFRNDAMCIKVAAMKIRIGQDGLPCHIVESDVLCREFGRRCDDNGMPDPVGILHAPGQRLHATERAAHHGGKLRNAQLVGQTCLCIDPVLDSQHGKIRAVRFPGFRIDVHRPRRTET